MGDLEKTEWEAAAFRTLVAHLRERTDVQNIDLMEMAGFFEVDTQNKSEWTLQLTEADLTSLGGL